MPEQAPFFFYTPKFIQILHENKITLVFSTYQAGKLIFLSSPTGEALYKYAKNFKRPMGVDVTGDRLAIASRNFVEIYSRSQKLARAFPLKPNHYDSFFTPQAKFFTGISDMHEIAFSGGELWTVNTSFSCITQMSDSHHFIPAWQPDFITELEPEDRCHLNGLIIEEGVPKFVTFFDRSNTDNGWRKTPLNTGMLWDCQKQEAIVEHLSMPHSPLKHGDDLFFLQSATGEVMKYNLVTKELSMVIQINSFLRGLDIIGDYLVIGASRIRQSSKTFKDLPITDTSFSGVVFVNYKTGERVASITYTEMITEIFEVKVLRNMQIPFMLTENDEGYDKCINCGDDLNYWIVENENNTDNVPDRKPDSIQP